MNIREKFVQQFGEEEAKAIEAAAEEHKYDLAEREIGDPFQYCLLLCIGFQCMEKDSYREHHGIKTPWGKLRYWLRAEANLAEYTGDIPDYITFMAGGYNWLFGFYRDGTPIINQENIEANPDSILSLYQDISESLQKTF